MKTDKECARALVELLDKFIENPDPKQVITELSAIEKDEERFTKRGPIHAAVVALEEIEKTRRENSPRPIRNRRLPLGGNPPWIDLLWSCRRELGDNNASRFEGVPVSHAIRLREWAINHYGL